MSPLEDFRDRSLTEYPHDEYFANESAIVVVTIVIRITVTL